jgi:uncharacterized protein (DUF433 family)
MILCHTLGMTDLLKRITQEEGKCGGRPCIRGMRIRVMDVLDMLAGGAKIETILDDFPDLEEDDIYASLAYASLAVDKPLPVAAE